MAYRFKVLKNQARVVIRKAYTMRLKVPFETGQTLDDAEKIKGKMCTPRKDRLLKNDVEVKKAYGLSVEKNPRTNEN